MIRRFKGYQSMSCKYCGATGHVAFNCLSKPKHRIQPRKRINRVGKVAKMWLQVRAQWFAQNPAEIYICFYCQAPMPRAETTLDHKESRSRRPDLRYADDNLVPCCAPCNTAKGSLSAEEYIQKLTELNNGKTNR